MNAVSVSLGWRVALRLLPPFGYPAVARFQVAAPLVSEYLQMKEK